MSIILQRNKQTGTTYAYESVYRWDKEKQQSRAKRVCVGKLDPETGKIVPTRHKAKKGEGKAAQAAAAKLEPVSSFNLQFLSGGAVRLLDAFAERTGLREDLKVCFPDHYKQLLSVGYFLVLEDTNPLIKYEKWSKLHNLPIGRDLSLSEINELFLAVTKEKTEEFFQLRKGRREGKEFWAYTCVCISSFLDVLKQPNLEKRREYGIFPFMNLLILYDELSGLPFYYQELVRQIPDRTGLKSLLGMLPDPGSERVQLVTEQGFSPEEKISELYEKHVTFLMEADLHLPLIKENLDRVYEEVRSSEIYDTATKTRGFTIASEWDCSQGQYRRKDGAAGKRKIYIHFFYDEENGEDHLISGQKEIQHDNKYRGYSALITNAKMDAFAALRIWRRKEVSERAFTNILERTNTRKLPGKSEPELHGKLFAEFIALLLLSSLISEMEKTGLNKSYTVQELFDLMDSTDCLQKEHSVLEVRNRRDEMNNIYRILGVKV